MSGYTKQERPYWNQFRNMIQTVYNPQSSGYNKFSHLGSQWGPRDYKKFERYINTYVGPQPQPGMKLCRKNQHKGWYAGNLVWWDPKTLSNNQLDNCCWITYKGRTQSMMAWSEQLGLSYHTIVKRKIAGWPDELIITQPLYKHYKSTV
jgi:hypothetical protein